MQHSMLFFVAAPVSVEEPGDEDSKMKDLILGATRAVASIFPLGTERAATSLRRWYAILSMANCW